eukprot:m.160181 g.160181  ORF g.160181 m.160181 type:complete len:146 (-) comp24814_c0_seq16:130-567(-)
MGILTYVVRVPNNEIEQVRRMNTAALSTFINSRSFSEDDEKLPPGQKISLDKSWHCLHWLLTGRVDSVSTTARIVRLKCTKGKSNKFYEVALHSKRVSTAFGPIGQPAHHVYQSYETTVQATEKAMEVRIVPKRASLCVLLLSSL